MYEETNERMLKAQEVATAVDISIQAMTAWYRWKEANPNHELAQYLPNYYALPGGRKTRFWKASEVWKLEEFKRRIPKGRHGIMGKVTQKYTRGSKNRDKKLYINTVDTLLRRNNVDEDTADIIKEFLEEEYAKRVA